VRSGDLGGEKMAENFIWGGVAAGAAICVVNPIDVVKTRLQMQGQAGVGQVKFSGPLHAFKSIAVQEGIRGELNMHVRFFFGFVSTYC
jgi:hypothetical protein